MQIEIDSTVQTHRFLPWRFIKIGSFHIGSSIADLLTTAVWNRIMIVDLGIVAWPVSLLTAVRYLLAPLTLWAGHRSDTRPILGSRRIAYIWLGRFLMLLSLPLLPLSTVILAREASSAYGWALAVASFLLFGIGTLISGAPFLALVHDSAPYVYRGKVIAIVQFILVVSYAFIPAVFALLMPVYTPESFLQLILLSIGVATVFWFVSIRGEERAPVDQASTESAPVEKVSFREVYQAILKDPRTRKYGLFLGTSAFFAFMQDAVLEPFGGDVFGLAVGETTRFNAFWGAGVLIGMLGTIFLTRRRQPHQQVNTTMLGLGLMSLFLLGIAWVAANLMLPWLPVVLICFGFGFGVFTVGGVSLLMAMSHPAQAASYLALWTVIQLFTRGAGIAAGGIVRDLAVTLTGSLSQGYMWVFLLEALGIMGSILLLRTLDVEGFASRSRPQVELEAMFSAAD
jgi:BCD family chlorophyll transporter-like MFS transporter